MVVLVVGTVEVVEADVVVVAGEDDASAVSVGESSPAYTSAPTTKAITTPTMIRSRRLRPRPPADRPTSIVSASPCECPHVGQRTAPRGNETPHASHRAVTLATVPGEYRRVDRR
jgi:hypothetical protein